MSATRPVLPPEPVTDLATLRLSVVSGDGQLGLIGHALRRPLVIQLLDGGRPVPGVGFDLLQLSGHPVRFEGSAGAGAFSDIHGRASFGVVLGEHPGGVRLRISARGCPELAVEMTAEADIPALRVVPTVSATAPVVGRTVYGKWEVTVRGRQLKDLCGDLDLRPLELAFDGSGVDLPSALTRRDHSPYSVGLDFVPISSPATVSCHLQVCSYQTDATLRLPPFTDTFTALRASTPIVSGTGKHPQPGGTLPKQIAELETLRVEPLLRVVHLGMPGLVCPRQIRLRVLKGRSTWSLRVGKVVARVQWEAHNGYLTTDPQRPSTQRQITLDADQPLYAIPSGWGPMSVRLRWLRDIPDPNPEKRSWTDPLTGQTVHWVMDRYQPMTTPSLTFLIHPVEPTLELQRGDDWVPVMGAVEVGDSVRLRAVGTALSQVAPVAPIPVAFHHPTLGVLGDKEHPSDALSHIHLGLAPTGPIAPAKGRTKVGRAQSCTLVSEPVGLRSRTPDTPDPVSTRLRVCWGGKIQIGAWSMPVAPRRLEPRRVPIDGVFAPPLSPHGTDERVGLRASLLPASTEATHVAVDLARALFGTGFELRRSWRSRVERAGPLGPGWGLAHERYLERFPGGLRLVDEDGEERALGVGIPGCAFKLESRVEPHPVGRIWVLTDPDDHQSVFAWDGALLYEETVHGRRLRYARGAHGYVSAIQFEDPKNARQIELEYHDWDAAAPHLYRTLRLVRDDLSREVELSYEARALPARAAPPPAWSFPDDIGLGLLVGVLHPDPRYGSAPRPKVTLDYDAALRLTEVSGPELTDPTLEVRLGYDGSGRAISETVGGSRTALRPGKATGPHDVEVTHPDGTWTKFTFARSPYADAGGVVRMVQSGGVGEDEPAQYTQERAWNTEGHLIRLYEQDDQDPDLGRLIEYRYESLAADPRARGILRATLRSLVWGGKPIAGPWEEHRIDPDTRLRPTRIIGPDGWASQDPDAFATTIERDPKSGAVCALVGPLATNSFRVPATVVGPPVLPFTRVDANASRCTYGQDGRLERRVGPDGVATRFEYDEFGSLVAMVIDADAQDSRRRSYWPFDPPRAMRVVIEPSRLGGTARVRWPNGATTEWVHDDLGREWESRTTINGVTTGRRVERDEQGRVALVYETLLPAGGERLVQEVLDYDPLGGARREKILVQDGWQTRMTLYDRCGRVVSRTEGGSTATLEYNGLGQIWREVRDAHSANPRAKTWIWDAYGRCVAERDALGRVDYVYSGWEDLVAVVDPLGNITRLRDADDGSFRIVEIYDGMDGRNPARKFNASKAQLVAREAEQIDLQGRVVAAWAWRSLGAQTLADVQRDPVARDLFTKHMPDPNLVSCTEFGWTARDQCSLIRQPDGATLRVHYDPMLQPLVGELQELGLSAPSASWASSTPGTTGAVVGAAAALGAALSASLTSGQWTAQLASAGHDAKIEVSGSSIQRLDLSISVWGAVGADIGSGRAQVKLDPHGRPEALLVGGVPALTLKYDDGTALPKRVDFPDGTWEEYGWGPTGALVALRTRDSAQRVLEYASNGALTLLTQTHVLPDGTLVGSHAYSYAYDALGRVVSVHVTYMDLAGGGGSQLVMSAPPPGQPVGAPLMILTAAGHRPMPPPTADATLPSIIDAIRRAGASPVEPSYEDLLRAAVAAAPSWQVALKYLEDGTRGMADVITFGFPVTGWLREAIQGEDEGVLFSDAYGIGQAAGFAWALLSGFAAGAAIPGAALRARAGLRALQSWLVADEVVAVVQSVRTLANGKGGVLDAAGLLPVVGYVAGRMTRRLRRLGGFGPAPSAPLDAASASTPGPRPAPRPAWLDNKADISKWKDSIMSDMSRFDTREARETLAAFRSGRAELVPEWRPDKLRGGCQPFGTNKCVINLAYAKPGTDAVRVAMHEFAHVKQQLTPCRYAWNKWYYEYMAERFAQRGIRGGMKHLQLVERVERGYPKGWWPDGWDPRRGFVY